MAADAFDEFVRARSPGLLRAAYLLTGDSQLAEDLVQNALVKTSLAWRRLERQENADAHARRVLYNQQVSWWRRRRVQEVLDDTVPEPAASDVYGGVDLRLSLRAALLALPTRQRAVIVCRYFDDLSEAETAEVLDMAIGTVKSQAHRALAALRATIPQLELQPSGGDA